MERIAKESTARLRDELTTQINGLAHRFERLEGEYHMLAAAVQRLEAQYERVATATQRVEGRLDLIEQRLAEL
jgi:hypothetical protein